MNTQKIIHELNLIFEDVIDEGKVELSLDTTAKDVEGWDSLNHVQIIYAIEQKYGIKFNLTEIQSLNNVGDLVNLISGKI